MLISILSRYSLKSKILSNIRSKSPSYSTSTILYVRNIYQVSEEELTKYILDLGQPKFRASQVKNWLYSKGAVDFEVI